MHVLVTGATGFVGRHLVTALVRHGEPLLTRYTAAILAKTQTYTIDAVRRDLGYEPGVSVAEGVERTLAELQNRAPHATELARERVKP